MKILYIGHEKEINGASRSMLELIGQFEKKHQIYVLTPSREGAFYEALQKHRVKVLVLPYYRWCVVKNTQLGWIRKRTKWYLYQQFVNRQTSKKMAQIVRDEKIDIIHSNSSVISIGGMIRTQCEAKHIWHIREFADLDFRMYPLTSKKSYYDFMNMTTDFFLCNSKSVANHYTLLDNAKKKVVYNGVSPVNILKDDDKMPHEGCNILISGRVEMAKGQYQAIKACQELCQRGVRNFHLYIAGVGKVEIPDEMKNYITLLGLVKNMPSLRKKMDFELVCSRAEAFGRVTVEAYLGGLPVIGSRAGGTVELIQDGITGFLYELDDISELSNKMSLLINDSTLRKRMGDCARDYAVQNFLSERCANEIESAYYYLLGEQHA